MCVLELEREHSVEAVAFQRVGVNDDGVVAGLQTLVNTGGANVLTDYNLVRGVVATMRECSGRDEDEGHSENGSRDGPDKTLH